MSRVSVSLSTKLNLGTFDTHLFFFLMCSLLNNNLDLIITKAKEGHPAAVMFMLTLKTLLSISDAFILSSEYQMCSRAEVRGQRSRSPCRSGRTGWRRWFRRRTESRRSAEAGPWWSYGTRPGTRRELITSYLLNETQRLFLTNSGCWFQK